MSSDEKGKQVLRQDQPVPPSLHFELNANDAICRFSGDWRVESGGCLEEVIENWNSFFIPENKVQKVTFSIAGELLWDSRIVVFIQSKKNLLERQGLEIKFDLPTELKKLIDLKIKERAPNEELIIPRNSLSIYFKYFLIWFSHPLNFVGAWLISVLYLFLFKTQMRLRDLIHECSLCGANALPIVTLISFLTGLTMAFVGSVQLEKFNAEIYIADLVCLAMVREMGALMVGIIMAGRTGASFAAEIGSMKLNEELDSLRTFDVAPIDFLVLPRTLALLIMTPMLTIYADIVGMLGGLTVGIQVMDFSVSHYLEQTQASISGMWEVFSGLLKSFFFGLIIGLVGCYKGLHSGNSSAAVGRSVTSSVVTSITLIVITDALFEITFSILELR